MEDFDEAKWRVAVNRKLNAIEISLAIANIISVVAIVVAARMRT